MTNPANPMDAVAALMLERQRIEQWLAALEAKKAITPPHVFERVRSDYTKRLDEVIDQLAGRTSELQETVAALTARLAKLQSEETGKRDQRYEAELRAAVGEYTPEQWQEYLRRSDEEINRSAADRASVSTELARLQQILSMAGGRASGAGAPPAEQARPETPTHTPAPVAAPRPQRFDELEFLKSVAGDARTAPVDGLTHGSNIPGAAAPVAPRVPTPRPGTPVPSSAPILRAPTPVLDASRVGPVSEAVVKTPEPPPLEDKLPEAARTLKCNACGHMNVATEWYCERCGGEMATT